MGDCSEDGRSGGMCLTPAPFCEHCSSRCGSHGPEMMPCGARRVPPSSLTFCLARAQVLLLYAALHLPKIAMLRSVCAAPNPRAIQT